MGCYWWSMWKVSKQGTVLLACRASQSVAHEGGKREGRWPRREKWLPDKVSPVGQLTQAHTSGAAPGHPPKTFSRNARLFVTPIAHPPPPDLTDNAQQPAATGDDDLTARSTSPNPAPAQQRMDGLPAYGGGSQGAGLSSYDEDKVVVNGK